jgi:hypothetical protein
MSDTLSLSSLAVAVALIVAVGVIFGAGYVLGLRRGKGSLRRMLDRASSTLGPRL